MEIPGAFELTGSYRDAAEPVGSSPSTVARYVAAREASRRPVRLVDEHLEKAGEWVPTSHGRVRADVVYQDLTRMGTSSVVEAGFAAPSRHAATVGLVESP